MKKILLIEDDPLMVEIYTKKLKDAGFQVDVATDGREGLEKIKQRAPDLLLLDIVLPQIDGWEILKTAREELGLKDLKVIILSNLGQDSEIEKSLKLGAVQYLIKAHYTPTEVVNEIKKYV